VICRCRNQLRDAPEGRGGTALSVKEMKIPQRISAVAALNHVLLKATQLGVQHDTKENAVLFVGQLPQPYQLHP
jgi:hypothetical protein